MFFYFILLFFINVTFLSFSYIMKVISYWYESRCLSLQYKNNTLLRQVPHIHVEIPNLVSIYITYSSLC